jgi:hypothetical protein
MPDRLALPDDRPHACHGCGAEKHEWLVACGDCEAAICSQCAVDAAYFRDSSWMVCRSCAVKRLNQGIAPLVPVCICSELEHESANTPWPSDIRYGQQLTLVPKEAA